MGRLSRMARKNSRACCRAPCSIPGHVGVGRKMSRTCRRTTIEVKSYRGWLERFTREFQRTILMGHIDVGSVVMAGRPETVGHRLRDRREPVSPPRLDRMIPMDAPFPPGCARVRGTPSRRAESVTGLQKSIDHARRPPLAPAAACVAVRLNYTGRVTIALPETWNTARSAPARTLRDGFLDRATRVGTGACR